MLALRSTAGARLHATLTAGRASGHVVIAGRRYPFTATPATGVAGLYRVRVNDGHLTGRSIQGGQLEGRIADPDPAAGPQPVPTTLTAPDGQTVQWPARQTLASAAGSAAGLAIVLDRHRARGAKTTGTASFVTLEGDY